MTFAFLAGAIRCGLSAEFGALFTGDSRGFGFSTGGVATCGTSLLGAIAIAFSSVTARGFDCRVTATGAFLVTTTGAASATGLSTGTGAGTGGGLRTHDDHPCTGPPPCTFPGRFAPALASEFDH